MTRDDLIGKWKLIGYGPIATDYTSFVTLNADGTAMTETDGQAEDAKWEYIDDTHWNLHLEIQPDPSIPGLEEGATDISEYEVTLFSSSRMEVVLFDHELPFVYERVA